MADLQDELNAAGEAGELDTPPDTPHDRPGKRGHRPPGTEPIAPGDGGPGSDGSRAPDASHVTEPSTERSTEPSMEASSESSEPSDELAEAQHPGQSAVAVGHGVGGEEGVRLGQLVGG
ncbi:hypothetical protein PV518_45400, partial [Streptomyces sp. ND04-05B]|nr:hypothetical protein [Streptomyces sp. ND04-05B]